MNLTSGQWWEPPSPKTLLKVFQGMKSSATLHWKGVSTKTAPQYLEPSQDNLLSPRALPAGDFDYLGYLCQRERQGFPQVILQKGHVDLV